MPRNEPCELFPESYLIKVNQFDGVARDSLDEWIYFLKNGEVPEGFRARGLQQAKEQLDVLKLSEEERRAYNRHQDDLHQQASMVQSSYGWGMHEGRKLGRQEVHQEGRQEGLQQGQARLLLRQLRRRFGEPLPWVTERLTAATPEQLEQWSERLLDAPTIEAIFEASGLPSTALPTAQAKLVSNS